MGDRHDCMLLEFVLNDGFNDFLGLVVHTVVLSVVSNSKSDDLVIHKPACNFVKENNSSFMLP